uniref:Trypsinogen n=1 Tax=Pediculus humanus TaxID=121225 RepID=Q6W741_9NEOP|nr:trypsinogen [Pediculus humanus]AAQ82537.1 trypsinogen [Pediculus humanus]
MIKVVLSLCLVACALGASIPNVQEEEGYIVGGKNTSISEVPYLVAMLNNGNFFCGGSVVAPNLVVTAAHCVYEQNHKSLAFRAGSSKANVGGVVVKAKKVHVHPKYDDQFVDYDVAVVELQQDLEFNKNVQPVEVTKTEPTENTNVRVSGWGRLAENGRLATTLQSVYVPVVDRETCDLSLKPVVGLTPRMFCAGLEGKDSCQGDSGGPLVDDGKLAGVVSFGMGCARRGKPGVYTNLANPEVAAFVNKYLKA